MGVLFFELMRQLTRFGKRVMAGLMLIVLAALLVAAGIIVCVDWAYKIGINQDAFNVITLFMLPVLCKLIVDMACIVKHGELI